MRAGLVVGAFAACAVLATSCGEDDGGPNLEPDTFLVGGPQQGTEHSYKVPMSWYGTDADGEVVAYEIALHDGIVYSAMFDELSWRRTTDDHDTLEVAADTCPARASKCHHTHTIFVRAVDNEGAVDRSPAYVGFDAKTDTPRSYISDPRGQGVAILPTCVKIKWYGTDADGDPPEIFRYALVKYSGDLQSEKPPPDSDSHWSQWKKSNQLTIKMLPSDPDNPDDLWSFYVQARDAAGAVEEAFDYGRNHILFAVDSSLATHPYVSICCSRGACDDTMTVSAGCRSTDNPARMNEPIQLPVGTEICFSADALPGSYARNVVGIAYVVNDPEEPGGWWYDYAELENRCYPPGSQGIRVALGRNTYYVWVKDDYCEDGSKARAYIIINGVSQQ